MQHFSWNRTHYFTVDHHHLHIMIKSNGYISSENQVSLTSLSAQGLRSRFKLLLRASHVLSSHLRRQRDQPYCQLILLAIDVRIFGLETCPVFAYGSDVMSPRHVSSSLIWCCVSPRSHLWSMASLWKVCPPDIPRVSQHLMLWRWYLKLNRVVAESVPKSNRNQTCFAARWLLRCNLREALTRIPSIQHRSLCSNRTPLRCKPTSPLLTP